MRDRDAPEKSHKGLILFCAFSIWFNVFGIGFFALSEVNKAAQQLLPDADPTERNQLVTARILAQFSVILFVMSWAGLILLVMGHGRKYPELRPVQNKPGFRLTFPARGIIL